MTESLILVVLPTQTKPSYSQKILGKRSPLSPDLDEFKGIPFGVVPGRWQHSHVRMKLPVDEYKAWSNGPKSPQLPDLNNSNIFFQSHLEYPADVEESEIDCLNLFIIRPSAAALQRIRWDEAEKLPVFIWIHGGGYGFGAGTDPMWDPSRLVLQSISMGIPIIAVNINYRLGMFGFAASSEILQAQTTSGVRGCNFGLRDQKVGLRWISQNITAFGGDATKIAVGGQSAGGCSIHVHVLDAINRHEKPSFRRACIQSGAIGTLGPITMARADQHWETLCRNLGLQASLAKSRLHELLSLSSETLLQAARELDWHVFPLVEDGLTVAINKRPGDHELSFEFNLGEVNDEPKVSATENIAILIGDTEVDGNIYRQHADAISNVSEIRNLFIDSLASRDAAEKLLASYGLTTGVSRTELAAGLLSFLTDATCGYHVASARRSFSKQHPPQKSHTVIAATTFGENNISEPQVQQSTTVQSYKIKFGNPFPGPDFEVAHHCAELIYLFDAFHDHMSLVDAETTVSKSVEPVVSNAALVSKLQQHWISFIAGDQKSAWQKSEIMIYEKDRTVFIASFETGQEWTRQGERFALLATEWKGVTAILKKIIGRRLM